MKTLKVQVDPETGDGFIDLQEFKDLVDVSKVTQFSLEPVDDDQPEGVNKALILTFYDVDGNVVKAGT